MKKVFYLFLGILTVFLILGSLKESGSIGERSGA